MTSWDDYKAEREGEALALVLAADAIHAANETQDETRLQSALEHNLQLWLAFKAISLNEKSIFPENTRESIIRLADFVSSECVRMLNGKPCDNLQTIAEINLQIAEGLLEALKRTEQTIQAPVPN
ncbi:flagellar biosynthesis regulator FlaF [Novispirillum itersonii]|uniref:flagellar biosynthesis regulator FlaF n=1 Tax=Novispirillum itersonii TaxID=189 RepID=UPI00036AB209|nr:flagellar biosynthesis regulator FlaF [Novispirillum itersonii]